MDVDRCVSTVGTPGQNMLEFWHEHTKVLPRLWESKALWNRVWKLALKVAVDRKDRLPHLLATISVGIKGQRLVSLRPGVALADCLASYLLQLSHCQSKKSYVAVECFAMTNNALVNVSKGIINNRLTFLPDPRVASNSKHHIVLICC